MNRRFVVSLLDMYMGAVCTFPIITIFVDEGIWTKALFVLIFLLHIGLLFTWKYSRKTVLLLVFFVIHYVYVIGCTEFPVLNLNLLFYFPFFLLYTYLICDHPDKITQWLLRRKRFLYFVIIIWTAIVGTSALIPSCYYIKEGGAFYFGSFCGSIFRLGPAAVFIQILALIIQVLHKEKKAICFSVLPMYCYLMGSSRTYLIVGLCILVIAWYSFCNNRKTFWTSAIPLASLALVLIGMSSMGEKIRYTLQDGYGDFWFRLTSSRSEFWKDAWDAWKETEWYHQLFGNDISFTLRTIGLWAHNDFLEILCSFGILGLAHYLFAVKRLFSCTYKKTKVPFVVAVCALMAWLFNAFFNMHYTYFCAMLSFPFLLMAIRFFFDDKMQNKRGTPLCPKN